MSEEDPVIRFSIPQTPGSGKRKPPALGRGLGALLGETRREEPLVVEAVEAGAGQAPASGLAMLSIATITPHPNQPRRHFDDAALDELAASIAQRGVIQPVIVRPMGEGKYQIIAGERRWRAAQRAQLHEIPALIRELGEREVMALALIENLQREDLNPVEEARAYQRLADDEGLTQAEIAQMVDKSRSHVANIQRLLGLPDGVLALVENGSLSMGHARALIGYEEAETLARNAVARQLSVREVERLVRTAGRDGTPVRRTAREERSTADQADIAAVQSHLEEFLGLSVKINADSDPRSGTVVIRYRTLDQLDLVCERLTGGGI